MNFTRFLLPRKGPVADLQCPQATDAFPPRPRLRFAGAWLAGLATLCLLPVRPLQAEIRLTTAEAVQSATSKPQPEYNPLAKQMKVEGDVVVEVHIGEEGEVSSVSVVNGNALLSANVVKAVKQWKFKPLVFEGKKTSGVTNLRFSFKL